jgi:hypothetical protein
MRADQAFDAAYTMALEKVLESSTDERFKGQVNSLIEERKKGAK